MEVRFGEGVNVKVSDGSGFVDAGGHGVVLFDCMNVDFVTRVLEGLPLGDRLVINIGPVSVENLVNIQLPFRVFDILQRIEDFISYSHANMIFCRFGTVNLGDGTFSGNGRIIRFTEREIELIRVVAERENIDRKDLMDTVWGPRTQNDKVLETTLYNIRRKLVENGAENLIEFSNGHYRIERYESKS
ncbi:MAG: winged helix-turn-helix domain-containing protein [Rickettsiales bacterium]|nr:winged helix-turn-helix domain-containing protein [Rickettsiales bacterium]